MLTIDSGNDTVIHLFKKSINEEEKLTDTNEGKNLTGRCIDVSIRSIVKQI